MAVQVAVLDDYQGVARRYGDWAALGTGVELTVFTDHFASPDIAAERLARYEVICAMRERTPFPAALLDRLPRLKLLVTTGMHNASIDLAAARRNGVTVSGTGGVAPATAELTWGLILALVRQIPQEAARVRAGGWQHTVGGDLAGSTLGVVGLGNLGARVASVGQAFGMRVLAWSQNLTEERAAALGVAAVAKERLFAESDVVTVHLKLADRTVGVVGEAELRAMRSGAYLVNTSRGPIVDQAALLRALREGWIAGAGLDVFDVEPMPADDPLRTAPNTILTPHLGYVTDRTYELFYRETVEDVAAYLAGAPIRTL